MRSIKISRHIKKTLCGAKIVSRETIQTQNVSRETFSARRAAFDAARFCFFDVGRPQEPAARRPIFFAVFSI
jgi:hypothetical protein